MYKQAVQNNLLWWSKRKWLYYISLCTLTYLAVMIAAGKMKSESVSLILFVAAVYFGAIAYAFTLLFNRIGLLYRSSSPDERDTLVDGQLVVNVVAIIMPFGYVMFSFVSSHVNDDLSSGFITFLINVVIAVMVFQPICQMLEEEYEPETKKMIGMIIWILLIVGLFVFIAFPSLNDALSRLRINKPN